MDSLRVGIQRGVLAGHRSDSPCGPHLALAAEIIVQAIWDLRNMPDMALGSACSNSRVLGPCPYRCQSFCAFYVDGDGKIKRRKGFTCHHQRTRLRAELKFFFSGPWFEMICEAFDIDPVVAREALAVDRIYTGKLYERRIRR